MSRVRGSRFRHHSARDDLTLASLRPCAQPETNEDVSHLAYGPRGFWVSDGDAWERWCRDENFRTDRLAHCYRITLADRAKIRWLHTIDDAERFVSEYFNRTHADRWGMRIVDWPLAARTLDGVVNLNEGGRLGLGIHRAPAWDVPSGCIWHPRAIARIDRLT